MLIAGIIMKELDASLSEWATGTHGSNCPLIGSCVLARFTQIDLCVALLCFVIDLTSLSGFLEFRETEKAETHYCTAFDLFFA
jgi:hypothetical protein